MKFKMPGVKFGPPPVKGPSSQGLKLNRQAMPKPIKLRLNGIKKK
jgi:hypothetical protein